MIPQREGCGDWNYKASRSLDVSTRWRQTWCMFQRCSSWHRSRRIEIILKDFTEFIFINICRGLFEESFLVCLQCCIKTILPPQEHLANEDTKRSCQGQQTAWPERMGLVRGPGLWRCSDKSVMDRQGIVPHWSHPSYFQISGYLSGR